jgi:hypothetical protein
MQNIELAFSSDIEINIAIARWHKIQKILIIPLISLVELKKHPDDKLHDKMDIKISKDIDKTI